MSSHTETHINRFGNFETRLHIKTEEPIGMQVQWRPLHFHQSSYNVLKTEGPNDIQVSCNAQRLSELIQNNVLIVSSRMEPNTLWLPEMGRIAHIWVTLSVLKQTNPDSFIALGSDSIHFCKYLWRELEWLQSSPTKIDLLAGLESQFPLSILLYHRLAIFISPDLHDHIHFEFVGSTCPPPADSIWKAEILVHDIAHRGTFSVPPNTWTSVIRSPSRLTDIIIVPLNIDPTLIQSIQCCFMVNGNILEHTKITEYVYDQERKGYRILCVPPYQQGQEAMRVMWSYPQVSVAIHVKYESTQVLSAYIFGLGLNTIRFMEGMMCARISGDTI